MATSKPSEADQLVIIHALQVLEYLVCLPHQVSGCAVRITKFNVF